MKTYGGVFDVDGKKIKLKKLNEDIEKPEVWQDHKKLQNLNKEKTQLEKILKEWTSLKESIDDNAVLLDLIEEEKDEKNFLKYKKDLKNLSAEIEKQEIGSLLNKENDFNDAYLSIHSGAGGTEAADWAYILYRMYLRWAEKQNYRTEILSLAEGEEAGIKSVIILVKGAYSYGYLRGESGVHRLVRISPFDSNSRRHTSFASVFSWPDIGDQLEVDINPEELRIDTYRAGGAGGQHVNKTDSAVRITHIPSGTVVQCQNQRSQHANKDKAMKMLKAALHKKEQEKKEQEKKERESSKKANEWGSQIRSYILHPYQMVKDHRTQIEHTNPKEVLDGDINFFIESYLKKQVL